MIYLYESTETDFRYNGKPLPTAYDVTVSNTLNSEYYVMGKHPLDKHKVYKEIVEDRIVKVHTMDGMEPFRIVSVSKHELYVEFEAWPLFYADMRNKLVKPLNLTGVSGQAALNSFKNNLLIDTPFDFYSDITDNHDYHTQDENERENNPKQLYNALDVFKTIVNRWGGELWIRGYDIRVNKRIGTDTEAMLYEKKNITEFVDTTNIEGIVTRLHGKSEWQDEPQEGEEGQKHSIEVTVDSPLVNDYSGVVFEKQFTNNDIRTEQELKNWLNLKFTTENIDKPQRTIVVGTNVIDETKIGFADTLILKYIKHDTDVRIKVVGYEYDGFANELKHVVLGQPKNTSSSTIGNTITDLVNNVVEPVDRKTTIAMKSADGKSTIFHGTADPNTLNLNAKENDTYFRTNGSEKEIWRFTGTLWELIIDTSDTTKNAREIEEKQKLIDEAKEVADQAVNEINIAIANAGFSTLDDTIKNVRSRANTALDTANDLIDDVDGFRNDVSGFRSDVSGFRSDVNGFTQTVNDYEGQVANFRSDVNGFQSTVAQYEDDVTGYATQVSSFSNSVDGFQSTVATYATNVGNYATKVSSLENTVDGFQSTVATYSTDIKGYATQVSTLNNTVDGFNSTVANVDGRVSTLSNTIDGISSTVTGYGGRISAVEQTASGLQTTVAGKANQSQVTQLATLVSSKVSNDDFTSQIGQLADNINLRVEKDDVINQINISEEKILIDADNILLNGDVTVRGTAWMDGAVLKNLSVDGAKIADATIGSAKIAGLNVDKITGETSDFVQSNWNSGVGGGVSISGTTGIRTRAASNEESRLENGGISFYDRTGWYRGKMDSSYSNDGTGGVSIFIYNGSHFSIVRESLSGYVPILWLEGYSNTMRMNTNMGFQGNGIVDIRSIRFSGGNAAVRRQGTTNNVEITTDGEDNTAVLFGRTTAQFHRGIDMNGNTITNQSDIRLKTNVEDSNLNALGEIERLRFIEYDWDKEKSINKGKPTERQFGLIAQYTPFLQTKAGESESYLSVDLTKQINLNSKATQELLHYTRTLEERIEVLENERTA